jgi:hypothetical protein
MKNLSRCIKAFFIVGGITFVVNFSLGSIFHIFYPAYDFMTIFLSSLGVFTGSGSIAALKIYNDAD